MLNVTTNFTQRNAISCFGRGNSQILLNATVNFQWSGVRGGRAGVYFNELEVPDNSQEGSQQDFQSDTSHSCSKVSDAQLFVLLSLRTPNFTQKITSSFTRGNSTAKLRFTHRYSESPVAGVGGPSSTRLSLGVPDILRKGTSSQTHSKISNA